MKKVLTILALVVIATTARAQKFALMDMEYVLGRIPAYVVANEKLNEAAQQVQQQVAALDSTAAAAYKDYQKRSATMTAQQRQSVQQSIMRTEKQAADLRQKYFGPQGELTKMREQLLTPIQDAVYEAVKRVAEKRGYNLVLDRASDTSIIFGSPSIDISDEVLQYVGSR